MNPDEPVDDFYPRPPTARFWLGWKPKHKKFQHLDEGVLCAGDREDTVRYITWYIKHAYEQMKVKRPAYTNPAEDIVMMWKYWKAAFGPQDSKVVCLEIHQKFLFDQQVALFLQDIDELADYVGPTYVNYLKTGLIFNNDSNQHIRMLFIDVLTRRFLLRAYVTLTLIKQKDCSHELIKKIMTSPFEQYEGLPTEFDDETYIHDEFHVGNQDVAIASYLDGFEKEHSVDKQPKD